MRRGYVEGCVEDVEARAQKWPSNKEVLADSYIDSIKLLYSTYKSFFTEEETEEMMLEQWQDLKAEINVPTLRQLPFHEVR
mgnify:CR=1 FL=1